MVVACQDLGLGHAGKARHGDAERTVLQLVLVLVLVQSAMRDRHSKTVCTPSLLGTPVAVMASSRQTARVVDVGRTATEQA